MLRQDAPPSRRAFSESGREARHRRRASVMKTNIPSLTPSFLVELLHLCNSTIDFHVDSL